MRKGLAILIVACGLVLPTAARGQVAWESPMLLPPNPSAGLGLFLIDTHGGGIGVLGTWRAATWNYGLRVGLAEGAGDEDIAIFGGIDYMGPVNVASSDFPLDIDWIFGAGLGIGDGVRASFPLGLTIAHSFQGEGARFTPFVTPRVVLDGFFGSDFRDDDLDLDVAMDLGLDLRLTRAGGPFDDTTIRFAASLGDREAIAIGLVF